MVSKGWAHGGDVSVCLCILSLESKEVVSIDRYMWVQVTLNHINRCNLDTSTCN